MFNSSIQNYRDALGGRLAAQNHNANQKIMSSAGFVGISYLIYLLLSLIMPSGHIGLLNVKFIALVAVICFFLISRQTFTKRYLLVSITILLACMFWLFIGILEVRETIMPVAQFKAVGITLLLPMLAYHLLRKNLITEKQIYQVILYSTVTIALLKLLLIVYTAAVGINFIGATQDIAKYFRTQIMTMHISRYIYRFELPSDLAAPIAMFILLLEKRHGVDLNISKTIKAIYFLLIIFTVFISYSRYIWAMLLIVFIVAGALSRNGMKYLLAAIVTMGVAAIAYHSDVQIVIERFSSSATTASDNIRLTELPILIKYFEISPIIGHGFGAYVPSFIRDVRDKFSYELQWVALLMQIGMVGFLAVGSLIALVMAPFFRPPLNKTKIAILLILMLWLSSGLFNPYLTSSAAGAIFTYFVAAGYSVRRVRRSYIWHFRSLREG